MRHKKLARVLALSGVLAAAGVRFAPASMHVLMMPGRDALTATDVVVWGNTTLPNGSAFSLDCGDGGAPAAGTVADQSYINRLCHYAAAGTYTATLTVAGESETAQITARDPAALSAFDLRAVKIDMAIEDGLRFLYVSQFDRAARFTTNMTSWRSATNENETNAFS